MVSSSLLDSEDEGSNLFSEVSAIIREGSDRGESCGGLPKAILEGESGCGSASLSFS